MYQIQWKPLKSEKKVPKIVRKMIQKIIRKFFRNVFKGTRIQNTFMPMTLILVMIIWQGMICKQMWTSEVVFWQNLKKNTFKHQICEESCHLRIFHKPCEKSSAGQHWMSCWGCIKEDALPLRPNKAALWLPWTFIHENRSNFHGVSTRKVLINGWVRMSSNFILP